MGCTKIFVQLVICLGVIGICKAYIISTPYATGIRLVNGSYPWEGRVEVYHNGLWGTICDDSFDREDAQVICYMLGYGRYGSIVAYSNALFGEGSGQILLDNLSCSGSESDIAWCSHNGWSHHDCGHSEDAGVSCRYPRSVDEMTTDDITTEVTTTDMIAPKTTQTIIGEVQQNQEHVQNSSPYGNGIRLVGGSYPWEGRVEVYHNGRWGTICDDSFDRQDAQVICFMLGYSRYGGPILLDELSCRGRESDIAQCSHQGWSKHNCGHGEDAGVSCRYPRSVDETTTDGLTTEMTTLISSPYTTGVRLVGGSYPWEGRVEVYHNGQWGTICDDSFDRREAQVICSMLGYYRYGSIVAYSNARFGQGSGPILLDNLSCSGYESDIARCSNNGWFQYNCRHYEDAGVSCRYPRSVDETTTDDLTTEMTTIDSTPYATGIRLVGGSYPWEGRVEVYHNGRWGTICDDSFDRQDAQVICYMLGYGRYGSIVAYSSARFGQGHGTIMLDELRCNGYESDIAQCSSNTWYNNDCSHSEDASVSCRYPRSSGLTTDSEETTTFDYFHQTISGSTDARYISVRCEHSNWNIKVYLSPLRQKYQGFRESDIFLGQHSCTGFRSGDYLVFNEDYSSCGTSRTASSHGIIYTNTLVYAVHDPMRPFIVHEYRFQIKVECDMTKKESDENTFNQNHGVTANQQVAGSGHFVVNLKFFRDSSFSHELNGFEAFTVGQNVYVKAETPIHDYNVKMILDNCYTKPSKFSSDGYIYYLIKNGCSDDPNAFIISRSTHETRFYFQDFEYAFMPNQMYVHCNATFCHANDFSTECNPRCSRTRVAQGQDTLDLFEQELNDEPNTEDNIGPIGYAEDEIEIPITRGQHGADQIVEKSTNYTGYAIGGVVVGLAIAIVVVGLFVSKQRRKNQGTAKIM